MEQTERERLLKRLVEWRPPTGILSVYVRVEPGDRGQPWRIELRDRLRTLADKTSPHAEQRAFEAAAHAVLERFPEQAAPPDGRGHVGFVEIAEKRPTEVWRSMQIAPRRTEVVYMRRPYMRPLIEVLSEGPHVGVVLTSSERVRLLDWSLGAMRQLDEWEITLWSDDWRERKAERSLPGPQAWTSASGRDQFDQRLDANRRRFLREVGVQVREQWGPHKWSYVLAIGAEDQTAELAEGLSDEAKRLHTAVHDLISAKEHDVAERVEAEVRAINERRANELLAELEEAIGAAPGVALGPQEALEALAEGRVRHLVFDADRDHDGQPLEANLSYDDGSEDGVPVSERLVELAVATAAEVTPLRGDTAARLEAHGGVAALLRY